MLITILIVLTGSLVAISFNIDSVQKIGFFSIGIIYALNGLKIPNSNKKA